jgi:hypothetical protein
MTVEQLIKKLQKVKDQKSIVLISSGSEKNHYFANIGINYTESIVYKKDSYEVEIGFSKLNQEELENGYSEDDVMSDGCPCVIIFPFP